MIYQTYRPSFPLSQFIEFLWFFEGACPGCTKERVLPNGVCELIINLRPEPKRLFDRENLSRYQSFRRSWISGTHSEFIVIDASENSSMRGIHFKPGGAHPFFEFPISELADAAVEFDTVWGGQATEFRDRLLELVDPIDKFRALEEFLLLRLSHARPHSHRVAFALRQFESLPHSAISARFDGH